MEFRLLGPLEVLSGGEPVQLGGRQRRTVLSLLLVHAGHSVSTEKLIDELWGDSPPDSARKTVQAHVAHLRKALNVDVEVIVSTSDGYRIRAEEAAVDIHDFERLVEEAKSELAQDPDAALNRLNEALGLFRGAPLAGLADDAFSLRVETSRLEELRLAAVEDRIEALIGTGDLSAATAQTERLLAENPLRERLWGLLMMALYRAGRQGEALQAFSRARTTLAQELGIEPSAELRRLEERILEQDPGLEPATVGVESGPVAERILARNPYKGLRPFDEADAADFFGREDLVRRMLERIEGPHGSPLVVLAGPSGTGKSSAVRAGLMPELRDRGREVAVMLPGADPLQALAEALAEMTNAAPGDLLELLRKGAWPDFVGILIVDQFEEVFTLNENPEDTDRLLAVLLNPGPSVHVLMTVRADFLDDMLAHPQIGGLLEPSLVLVPPLQEHEIIAAVVNPARRVGVNVDSELVSSVVHDVQRRAAALPLLQFALTDTFDRRRGERLTLDDYERAGGISGALSRRADNLYASLDAVQADLARQLLLQMVTITEDGEQARRRVDKDTLISLADPETMTRIIERFGAQRLLIFDQNPGSGHPTVEIAHEALMAEWPRLAGWIGAARDDLRMRRRLAVAVAEWEESGKEDGFLLTGARLREMEASAERSQLSLVGVGEDFLSASRDAENQAAVRRSRTRRVLAAILTGATAIAASLAIVAFLQAQEARDQKIIAEDQARLAEEQALIAEEQALIAEEQALIATVRELAAASTANLERDPELSILLAIEAVKQSGNAALPEAEEALHRALMADRLLSTVPNAGNGIAHFSPNGDLFVTLSPEDPLLATIWRAEPLEPLIDLAHQDLVLDAVFHPEGDRVLTTSLDGQVRIFDILNADVLAAVEAPQAAIPAFNSDGSMFAASAFSGVLRVWETSGEKLLWELPAPEGTEGMLNLEFSPDGRHLAAAYFTSDGPIGARMWDLVDGSLARTFEGHEFDPRDLGFTPDGKYLVTGGNDATVRIFDVDTGDNIKTYFGHQGPVSDLQISEDGTLVASSGFTDVLVWEIETLRTVASILGHTGEVDGIDLSPGADRLLTASQADRTTRIWDLSPFWSHEKLGVPGAAIWFGAVDFSPDGSLLAASKAVGEIGVWDIETGTEIAVGEGPGPTFALAFAPEGELLAAAGLEGAVVLNPANMEVVASIGSDPTNQVIFRPSGVVFTTGPAGTHRWEVDGTGQRLFTASGYTSAASPDGTDLVMSYEDDAGSTFFLDIISSTTGESIYTFPVGFMEGGVHSRPIFAADYSHDGSMIASGSEDATVAIWDTESFEVMHHLVGHAGGITDVEFSPDSELVATASFDGTVKFWEVATGFNTLTLPLPGEASGLAYSQDGRYLAVTGPGGWVSVFVLDTDELVELAESRVTRWWSTTECEQYLHTEECPDPPKQFQ